MSKKTIVLADNSYTIRRIVELSFSEEEDIELISFENSFNLREKLLELKPAIVLVDIKLPEFNGYEVCRFINTTQGLAHAKVFLLKGGFEPIDESMLQGLRFVDIITKPFDSNALVSNIKQMLLETPAVPQAAPAPPMTAAPGYFPEEDAPPSVSIGDDDEGISFSDVQTEVEADGVMDHMDPMDPMGQMDQMDHMDHMDRMDHMDDEPDMYPDDDVLPSEEITLDSHFDRHDSLAPTASEDFDNPFRDDFGSDDADSLTDEELNIKRNIEIQERELEIGSLTQDEIDIKSRIGEREMFNRGADMHEINLNDEDTSELMPQSNLDDDLGDELGDDASEAHPVRDMFSMAEDDSAVESDMEIPEFGLPGEDASVGGMDFDIPESGMDDDFPSMGDGMAPQVKEIPDLDALEVEAEMGLGDDDEPSFADVAADVPTLEEVPLPGEEPMVYEQAPPQRQAPPAREQAYQWSDDIPQVNEYEIPNVPDIDGLDDPTLQEFTPSTPDPYGMPMDDFDDLDSEQGVSDFSDDDFQPPSQDLYSTSMDDFDDQDSEQEVSDFSDDEFQTPVQDHFAPPVDEYPVRTPMREPAASPVGEFQPPVQQRYAQPVDEYPVRTPMREPAASPVGEFQPPVQERYAPPVDDFQYRSPVREPEVSPVGEFQPPDTQISLDELAGFGAVDETEPVSPVYEPEAPPMIETVDDLMKIETRRAPIHPELDFGAPPVVETVDALDEFDQVNEYEIPAPPVEEPMDFDEDQMIPTTPPVIEYEESEAVIPEYDVPAPEPVHEIEMTQRMPSLDDFAAPPVQRTVPVPPPPAPPAPPVTVPTPEPMFHEPPQPVAPIPEPIPPVQTIPSPPPPVQPIYEPVAAPAPAAPPSQVAGLNIATDAIMKTMEDKLGIAIREMLWEIIPPLAEKLILEEIEKIKAEAANAFK